MMPFVCLVSVYTVHSEHRHTHTHTPHWTQTHAPIIWAQSFERFGKNDTLLYGFNPSTWETEADKAGPQSKFHDGQDYTEKARLNKPKPIKQTKLKKKKNLVSLSWRLYSLYFN